ncbi:MAG: bifunctional UDP-N-acetylglucosamine diphosphorylase/glucosamine-1-phosphate N-acetyltransferase GlmU [Inquilinus sp.]|nr:bifunctional UDP-N-acetylglucosamine diphosphorylase/glucosamine-1-phosphate N-acetyltransferase GlmU [Inquilinus sp.]
MPDRPVACVVLAAGKGTRLKSRVPKVLHPVAGWPMLRHVLDTLATLGPDRAVVVVGPDMKAVEQAAGPWPSVVQPEQRGTADAVAAAREVLAGFDGDVLVMFGDTPLVTEETLRRMLDARRGGTDPAIVVLGMRPDDPGHYGRLVLDEAGGLETIVEYLDATAEQRAIGLCNGGLMAFDGRRLFELLDRIGDGNAKGEFYLTDAVAVARAAGQACAVVEGSAEEVHGINSRADLAEAERLMQNRLRARAMEGGATLTDPESVFFAADTVIGRDVTIAPSVVFGPGATIEDDVEIRAFCHIEGALVQRGAVVGPFARLRPGTDLGPAARIGNFVEVKNVTLGEGAKANHLTYLGDASVGAGANIGAGTITCNYDGYLKHRTEIGEAAFIGSNVALVAPVRVGDRANVGAGSVVARDVADDALAIGRAEQVEKPGHARRYREKKAAEKAAQARRPK